MPKVRTLVKTKRLDEGQSFRVSSNHIRHGLKPVLDYARFVFQHDRMTAPRIRVRKSWAPNLKGSMRLTDDLDYRDIVA